MFLLPAEHIYIVFSEYKYHYSIHVIVHIITHIIYWSFMFNCCEFTLFYLPLINNVRKKMVMMFIIYEHKSPMYLLYIV